MKKMYLAPEMEVIELRQTACLLAGSDPGLGGGGGGVADAPEIPYVPDMSDMFDETTWNALMGNY